MDCFNSETVQLKALSYSKIRDKLSVIFFTLRWFNFTLWHKNLTTLMTIMNDKNTIVNDVNDNYL